MVDGSIFYWYYVAQERLRDVVGDPRHEALLLCEHFFGFSGRAGLNLRGDEIPGEDSVAALKKALDERIHRPLQYILGEWPFMGRPYAVGEGVLCPREDTQILVETVLHYIRGDYQPPTDSPNKVDIIDLCAGSGIVGLSLVQEIESACCTFVELSEKAIKYLRLNISRYGGGRACLSNADVLNPPPVMDQVDIIVSNPPYIPSRDIKELSREVGQEPEMALDGGEDGLVFYRAILENWLPLLRPGGLLAVEIGCGQSAQVLELFSRHELRGVSAQRDLNKIDRVIHGTVK